MGYNLTKAPVIRNLPQLKQLFNERRTLDFRTGTPRKTAYKLREATKAAAHHDEFSHLAVIDELYRFCELPGLVRAEYLGEPEALTLGSAPSNGEKPHSPPPPSAQSFQRKTLPDVHTLLELLGVAQKFSGPNQELYFPSVVLMPSEQKKLYDWAQLKGWNYLDHNDSDGVGGLTLTRQEVPDDALWAPKEEEE